MKSLYYAARPKLLKETVEAVFIIVAKRACNAGTISAIGLSWRCIGWKYMALFVIGSLSLFRSTLVLL